MSRDAHAVEANAVTDTGIVLNPDHGRVITRFFVPGQEDVGPGDSRAAPVIERILELPELDVTRTMEDIDRRFVGRHRELRATFDAHAELVIPRLPEGTSMSDSRRRLLGASFTSETSIEGASLCNPSMVLHPSQPADGRTTFVLSVRAISEGHRSSIGFRTGAIDAEGIVTIDPVGVFPELASVTPGMHHRSVVHRRLADLPDGHENSAFVLDPLPAVFDDAELQARIDALAADAATRRHTRGTITHLKELIGTAYIAQFPDATEVSERVLWPHTGAERQGMEDARFVRFLDDDGAVTYFGTYTAFDGVDIAQHLLSTDDFARFEASPMAGSAATGKGLALFPRRVHGRYAALSRSDRETNSVAFSDDLHCWDTSVTIQTPVRSWEILQLGNCGSPIEIEEGWLVLTHGVGPMRTYCLGAILLDLDDPTRVLAHSDGPILRPTPGDRDGYVPNVVYSCGALARGDLLVIPYGIGDQTIRIGTMSIAALVGSMRPSAVRRPTRLSRVGR